MGWERSNGYVVFTHDLDFGMMLALTQVAGPSVLQVRGQKVLPDQLLPCRDQKCRIQCVELQAF